MTNDATKIIARVRQGHGTAGKLLTDDTVASNVDTTSSDAKQTSSNLDQASQKVNTIVSDIQKKDLAEVQKTLENTRDMTAQLNQAVGTFLSSGNQNENTALALRDTVQGARQTLSNLADDTEAVKHNFFYAAFLSEGASTISTSSHPASTPPPVREKTASSSLARSGWDFSTLAPMAPKSCRARVDPSWTSLCLISFLICRIIPS